MIDKHQNPLTKAAIQYTCRQLALRAGIDDKDVNSNGFESLGLQVYYSQPELVTTDRPCIVIVPTKNDSWFKLLDRDAENLDWLPIKDLFPSGEHSLHFDNIPVLFWGKGCEDGSKPFAESWKGNSIIFYADIIAAAFFLLSRWEEMVSDKRDEHQRFPGAESVAYKQGYLDLPVVDIYGIVLTEWLKKLLPHWHPKPIQFSVLLSHDIDSVTIFSNPLQAFRNLVGDLVKRRNLSLAWQTIVESAMLLFAKQKSSYIKNIYLLANLTKKHRLDSAFYFMAAERGEYDDGYEVSSLPVRECIQYLLDQKFEVGIHPSYFTLNNPALLEVEKRRLDRVIGQLHYGGRQHFLRFSVPDTWRHWEQLGFSYDSTLGFADQEGFRCGTCHPFRPFDMKEDSELNFLEIPLIVMDVTLIRYKELSPQAGKVRILELARRCKDVGGVFTLLWHNSSLIPIWSSWQIVYEEILAELNSWQENTGI